jgi:hypothetical protein
MIKRRIVLYLDPDSMFSKTGYRSLHALIEERHGRGGELLVTEYVLNRVGIVARSTGPQSTAEWYGFDELYFVSTDRLREAQLGNLHKAMTHIRTRLEYSKAKDGEIQSLGDMLIRFSRAIKAPVQVWNTTLRQYRTIRAKTLLSLGCPTDWVAYLEKAQESEHSTPSST